MNATAVVFRARLGAALRALPTELRVAGHRQVEHGHRGGHGLRRIAAGLELASPGLALMMQLRARLFHDVLRAAAARGFRAAVVVGGALDRRRMRRLRRLRLPITVVDHPAVLAQRALRRDAGDRVRLTAADLGAGLSDELHGRITHAGRALFLVEGLSMWGDATALRAWLRTVAAAAPGSELLLNVLESASVDRARRASGAAAPRFGIERARLMHEIIAAGLVPLRVFDSGEVETTYLGIDDLLVRELYGWARVGGTPTMGRSQACRDAADRAAAKRPCSLAAEARGSSALAVRDLVGPARSRVAIERSRLARLHREVRLLEDGYGRVRAVLAVTPLRTCARTFVREDSMLIRRLDGTQDVAELGTLPADNREDAQVRLTRIIDALGTAGFLDDADDPSSLAAVTTRALAAIAGADPMPARAAARALVPFAANPAAAHLHARLRAASDLLLERDGNVAVLAARATTARSDAATIAQTASRFLLATARVLRVRFSGSVLIDVTSSRAGVPVTMIAAAAPHTLVHIPRPRYSPAVLSHELTHVLAMCASRWLSEGLAVWIQRLISPGACFPDDVDVNAGAREGALETCLLADARLTRDGSDAERRAYREAASFVEWLVRRSGAAAFTRFFAALGVDGIVDVDAACAAVGVPSLAALDREWRRSW